MGASDYVAQAVTLGTRQELCSAARLELPRSRLVQAADQLERRSWCKARESSRQLEMTFDDMFLGIASNTNETFNFTFDVPDAQPGPHLVKAVDVLNGISVVANFTVTGIDTLAVNVDVGTLYFPGDTATIYTLATLSGAPLNSTTLQLQLPLKRPDGSNVTLTTTFVGGGLFKSAYTVPTTGPVGTYAVVAKAHVANVQDSSALTAFEVKPTWLSAQAPALTTTAVALTGALAVGAVVWKRGSVQKQARLKSGL